MKASLVIVVLIVLAAAGCGGGRTSKGPAPTAPQAQAPAAQNPPASTSPLPSETPGAGSETQVPQSSQPSQPSQTAPQPAQQQPGAEETQLAFQGTPAETPSPQAPSQPATQAAAPATPAQPAAHSISGNLKVVNFTFLQAKDGPPRPEGPYKLDDTIHARVEVTGSSTGADGKIHIRYTWTALDPNVVIMPILNREVHDTLEASAPVQINLHLELPPYAPPGAYKLQINVHDVIKNTDADSARTFAVQGPSAAPSTHLEVRDFTMSRSKGGPPATPPTFRGGQTVYVSAKVAGMKFNADRLDVRIACQLVGPDSQVLLDKPDCIDIKQSVPYHPPTFFATVSQQFSLPADVPKGTHTIKYMLTDNIGNVTESYQATFEVR